MDSRPQMFSRRSKIDACSTRVSVASLIISRLLGTRPKHFPLFSLLSLRITTVVKIVRDCFICFSPSAIAREEAYMTPLTPHPRSSLPSHRRLRSFSSISRISTSHRKSERPVLTDVPESERKQLQPDSASPISCRTFRSESCRIPSIHHDPRYHTSNGTIFIGSSSETGPSPRRTSALPSMASSASTTSHSPRLTAPSPPLSQTSP